MDPTFVCRAATCRYKQKESIQLHEFKQAAPDRHLGSHERGFQENYHVYHRIFIWKVKAEVCVKK